MTAYNNMAPKPTKYKGVTYKSRLEAKWAVVFDELGIKAEYEIKQVQLNGTGYMPDFYLPKFDLYVEVKGQMREEDEYKILEFSKNYCILAVGNFKLARNWNEMLGAMIETVYQESWNCSRVKPFDLLWPAGQDEWAPFKSCGVGQVGPIWRDIIDKEETFEIYQRAAKKMDWEPIEEVKAETVKESFKPEKENRETRSARLQLVTTPTLRDMVDKRAKNAKVSRNEFIIQALEYVLSL